MDYLKFVTIGSLRAMIALLSVYIAFVSLPVNSTLGDESQVDAEDDIDYRPDRVLTKEEVKKIRELSETLLTKTIASDDPNKRNRWQGKRRVAATRLGGTHHRDALPALIAALKDKTNPESVRVKCVRALGEIYDKRMVDALLDVCVDEHVKVEAYAQIVLSDILPRDFLSSNLWTKERRKQEVQKWREWWDANRDKIEVDRERLGDRGWLQPKKTPKKK